MRKLLTLIVTLLLLAGCSRDPVIQAKRNLTRSYRFVPTQTQTTVPRPQLVAPQSAALSPSRRARLEGRWRDVLARGWVGSGAQTTERVIDEVSAGQSGDPWSEDAGSAIDAFEPSEDLGDDAGFSEETDAALYDDLPADEAPSEVVLLLSDDAEFSAMLSRIDALESRLQQLEQDNEALTLKLLLHGERLAFFQTALAVDLLSGAR